MYTVDRELCIDASPSFQSISNVLVKLLVLSKRRPRSRSVFGVLKLVPSVGLHRQLLEHDLANERANSSGYQEGRILMHALFSRPLMHHIHTPTLTSKGIHEFMTTPPPEYRTSNKPVHYCSCYPEGKKRRDRFRYLRQHTKPYSTKQARLVQRRPTTFPQNIKMNISENIIFSQTSAEIQR